MTLNELVYDPNGKSNSTLFNLSEGHHQRRGALILILLLIGSPAAAQDPKPKHNLLENLALCNGIDRTSPELQIDGCTAVIDSGERTPAAAIAYNNRGDAYAEKGDYDRAVQDFDQSIKLNPTNAKPLQQQQRSLLEEGRIRPRDQKS